MAPMMKTESTAAPGPRPWEWITAALDDRRRSGNLRQLRPFRPADRGRVEVAGRVLVNCSANDYLGLSRHPEVVARAADCLRRFGAGSTASRLVCGTLPICEAVEARLARLKGTGAALLFPTGLQLNTTLLAALADRHTLILVDRLAHRSIIDGARLAAGRFWRFRHNDLHHLEDLLRRHRSEYNRCLVMTETVFSMDGDRLEVAEFSRLCRRYDAFSIVDEAHATGVLGEQGMGLAVGHDLDLVMGTFGKGCGSFGAYVATSPEIRDYLVNFCAGFIYTTALPPAVLGAVDAALDLVPGMEAERRHLAANAHRLRRGLTALGLDCGRSSTQIVPVILGDAGRCLDWARRLEAAGYLAVAIRPPTVEKGRARLRLALSALHSEEDINGLLAVFARLCR